MRIVTCAVSALLMVGLMGSAAWAQGLGCDDADSQQNVDCNEDGTITISEVITTFPLLWVANAGEDTISKIDTETNKEIARYRTWFGGVWYHGAWTGPAPSRSAVDSKGNAYVLNRHFDGRPAHLVKILNTGGIDRNGNGVIDTSHDANGDGVIQSSEMYLIHDTNGNGVFEDSELVDERVAWIKPVGGNNGLGRACAIDLDDNIWVGLYNTRQFYQVDGETGAVLQGPFAVGYHPYGAVVDSIGRLFSTQISGGVSRLDTTSANPGSTIANAGTSGGYGMAVGSDPAGTEWVLTASYPYGHGFNKIDPNTLGASAPASGSGYRRPLGISIDQNHDIIIGSNGSSWNGLTKYRFDGSVVWSRGPNPTYISDQRGAVIDSENNIWTINRSHHNVSKFDTNGNALAVVPVGREPYTYSDATGIGVQFSNPTGIIDYVVDGGTPGMEWGTVCFCAEGDVEAAARAADDIAGLDAQNFLLLATQVEDGKLCAEIPIVGQYLEVQFSLQGDGVIDASGDCGDGGGGIEITPANEPPTAVCAADQTIVASADACEATMPNVDDGSSDPDGDALSFAQDPAEGSALGLGETTVSLVVSDGQADDSCSTTVTVVDEAAPTIACNNDATLTPPDAGAAFTATATDSCGGTVTVTATGDYSCTFTTGNGKVKEREDCVLTFDGGTVTIDDTSGVGTHITYTVEATDEAGNTTTTTCELDIVNPGNGGGNGGDGSGCNNGGGNGDEGCSPGQGSGANDDESGDTGGNGKGKGKKK